ncbi:MAG TPA: hypothetical protein EYQ24_13600 [Bacteroidetes bacterium]|nr:hypothetical protein [Bacteroidota bacterium]HIL56852.1 hypothetical protein [Rhodothermales bacterium]
MLLSSYPARSDAALSLALYRAARRVEAASAPVLAALGLEYEAYLVLAQLWAADGATEGRLGATLGISSASERSRVNSLVAHSYAERQGARIWLTDDGHRARAVASRALDRDVVLDDVPLAHTRHLLDQLAETLAP